MRVDRKEVGREMMESVDSEVGGAGNGGECIARSRWIVLVRVFHWESDRHMLCRFYFHVFFSFRLFHYVHLCIDINNHAPATTHSFP